MAVPLQAARTYRFDEICLEVLNSAGAHETLHATWTHVTTALRQAGFAVGACSDVVFAVHSNTADTMSDAICLSSSLCDPWSDQVYVLRVALTGFLTPTATGLTELLVCVGTEEDDEPSRPPSFGSPFVAVQLVAFPGVERQGLVVDARAALFASLAAASPEQLPEMAERVTARVVEALAP